MYPIWLWLNTSIFCFISPMHLVPKHFRTIRFSFAYFMMRSEKIFPVDNSFTPLLLYKQCHFSIVLFTFEMASWQNLEFNLSVLYKMLYKHLQMLRNVQRKPWVLKVDGSLILTLWEHRYEIWYVTIQRPRTCIISMIFYYSLLFIAWIVWNFQPADERNVDDGPVTYSRVMK